MNLGLRERKKERERNKRERVITSEKGKERAKILGQYLGCLFYIAKKSILFLLKYVNIKSKK